jgi:hypothetical protein
MSFPKKFTSSNPAVKTQAKVHYLEFTGIHINQTVRFLAFLASFSQNWASTWNSELVYGRIDPIGSFQGNQRTLTLTWDIPSGGITEAKDNMKRMNGLAQLIYPTYAGTGNNNGLISTNALTLSASPLIRIKYANLISSDGSAGLLGYITAMAWNPSLEMGVFEEKGRIYPKVVSLNISFTVLHENDIGWKNGNFGDAKFPFGGS